VPEYNFDSPLYSLKFRNYIGTQNYGRYFAAVMMTVISYLCQFCALCDGNTRTYYLSINHGMENVKRCLILRRVYINLTRPSSKLAVTLTADYVIL
jgi:hypothetical protein